MNKTFLFLTCFILLFTNIKLERKLQSSFIECSAEGNCQRTDGVELILGWVPKVPSKNYDDIFDTTPKEIVSLNPFTNSVALQFIKKSEKYTCADGVNECFNSCCAQGLCTDPSNVCTTALKSSAARVYATCIAYVLLAIAYWSIFGYLGVRYSKKKSTILVDGLDKDTQINKSAIKSQLLNDNNESVRSRGVSALENFEDKFNSDYNPSYSVNYLVSEKKVDSSRLESKILGKETSGVTSQTNLENIPNNKLNNNRYIPKKSEDDDFNNRFFNNSFDKDNENNKNKLDELKNVEMINQNDPDLDDHVLDNDINVRQSSTIKNNEQQEQGKDESFEVKDLNY